jgi:hypothetical protein
MTFLLKDRKGAKRQDDEKDEVSRNKWIPGRGKLQNLKEKSIDPPKKKTGQQGRPN